MQKVFLNFAFLTSVAALAGCGQSGEFQDYKKAELSPATEHDHHDHGEEAGIHGGHIIEIGDTHGIHAEMAFDKESRNITLYFYGATIGEAKVASGLEFELGEGDSESSLEVSPSPLDGETAEMSSRFVISGMTLPKEITSEEQLNGHLHVTIDGQEYVASFHAHTHDDHAGHDHENGESIHSEHDHAEHDGHDKAGK